MIDLKEDLFVQDYTDKDQWRTWRIVLNHAGNFVATAERCSKTLWSNSLHNLHVAVDRYAEERVDAAANRRRRERRVPVTVIRRDPLGKPHYCEATYIGFEFKDKKGHVFVDADTLETVIHNDAVKDEEACLLVPDDQAVTGQRLYKQALQAQSRFALWVQHHAVSVKHDLSYADLHGIRAKEAEKWSDMMEAKIEATAAGRDD